ncbi:MAG: proteasome subunit beta [Nitrososphaerota archaeon]
MNIKRIDTLMENIRKTGTTTVGLSIKDAVVFATDTRVTAGYFVAHRKGKKLFPLSDNAAITIAGRVADAQVLINILKANINYYQITHGKPMDIISISRLAANLFFRERAFPLLAQVIIGGVDSTGSHLYTIDFTGSLTEENIVSTGSGSPIAYGIIEAEYRKDLTLEEALMLSAKAVASAIKRDIGTGDSIDLAYISKTKGYTELSPKEKEKYVKPFIS